MAELQRYGATKKTGEDSYKVLKICDSMKDVDGEMDVQQLQRFEATEKNWKGLKVLILT